MPVAFSFLYSLLHAHPSVAGWLAALLQGSTSVVWQNQSFWDRRPTSNNAVLPLFAEAGLGAAVAPLSMGGGGAGGSGNSNNK
jgi:hypothetical protein